MTAATLTSKGRVTIPVDVRNQLGLESGDRIEFSFNEATGRYEVYGPFRPWEHSDKSSSEGGWHSPE